MKEVDYSGHSAEVQALLARADHSLSEFLAKLGVVNMPDPEAPGVSTAIKKLRDTVCAGISQTDPQRKVYLGTVKQPVSVDTLRAITNISSWADRCQMKLAFENDGRIYLTSDWWNYKDPNQFPWGDIRMTFDLLSYGLE